MPQPTGKSLTLDLLSTLGGGSMPIAALVAAGELFGIPEGSLRVAVTRLVRSGRVERDERGSYRLGPAAVAVDREVRRWRRLEEQTRRWNGRWIAVQGAGSDRSARRDGERARRWQGFRELEPGLWVRPDNLRGGVAARREALLGLGLEPGCLVFRLDSWEAETEARARGLWDAAALVRGYEQATAELERSTRRLDALPEGEAMVESFQLGGRILRELALDPLLPDELVDPAPRRGLVRAMAAYDRRGRAAWSDFMTRHGAPSARAPLHIEGGASLRPVLGELR